MKIAIRILSILITIVSCVSGTAQTKGIRLVEEKFGDLDNDGIDEKVVVYETNDSTEFGNVREIIIYNKIEDKWSEWHKSRNAILKSEEGGMMGDPFQGIEIANGILKVYFFGGSSWRWSYTDSYKYQNNQFELIKYSSRYFKFCEFRLTNEIDFSTGIVISNKEYEKCENDEQVIFKKENETFINRDMKIYLQTRNAKEVKIKTPKYKREIYIAHKLNEYGN